MAANTEPRWGRTPNAGSYAAGVTTATGDTDGTGGNNQLILTAGSDHCFVERIRLLPLGANVPSLMRFYLNNGTGSNGTATNNQFIHHESLPQTIGSSTASSVVVEIWLGFVIPAGSKIYMGLATTVASGWRAFPITQDY